MGRSLFRAHDLRRGRPKVRRPEAVHFRRLTLEALEDRCLLAFGDLLHTLVDPGTPAQSSAQFGQAVAADGDLVVVGAPGADLQGLNDSGTAHVFNSASGALVATLLNPATAAGGQFGYSVAISGNTAVVGAPFDGAGAAYVFNASTGSLLHTLINPAPETDDEFGYSVAISGTTVVVGAPRDDASGTDAGEAYVFNLTGGNPPSTLVNPTAALGDYFGNSVAISGSTVVVGAPYDDTEDVDAGALYTFGVSTGNLLQTVVNPLVPLWNSQERFGSSVAISGDKVVAGVPGFGSFNSGGTAWLIDLTSGAMQRISDGTGDEDQFGFTVAIFGTDVAIGSAGKGVQFFYLHNGTWFPAWLGDAIAGDSYGSSVALSGHRAVVGAPYADSGVSDAGTAYVFETAPSPPSISVADLVPGDTYHLVFTSSFESGITGSTTVPPNYPDFGGLAAADWIVTFDAFNASYSPPLGLTPAAYFGSPPDQWDGLATPWKAILSTETETAGNRIPIIGPLFSTDGDFLAMRRNDFWDRYLPNPLNYDEYGHVIPGSDIAVWTGTSSFGGYSHPSCVNWTESGSTGGAVGNAASLDGQWVLANSERCDAAARLYGVSPPITVQSTLDVDGNGTADALSDGILILRYLFDRSGAWNIADALGSGARRSAREIVKPFLDAEQTTALDVDGNGSADALSDGILILRYLFDPTGAWNVNDAIGTGATRTTREAIKAYLDQYKASMFASPAATVAPASPAIKVEDAAAVKTVAALFPTTPTVSPALELLDAAGQPVTITFDSNTLAVAAATWCPHCRMFRDWLARPEIQAQLDGLHLMFVFGDESSRGGDEIQDPAFLEDLPGEAVFLAPGSAAQPSSYPQAFDPLAGEFADVDARAAVESWLALHGQTPAVSYHGADPLATAAAVVPAESGLPVAQVPLTQIARVLAAGSRASIFAPLPGPASPGYLRMAISGTQAIIRFVGSGLKTVSAETLQGRLEQCRQCSHYTGSRCRVCGCLANLKARLPKENCPLAQWPELAPEVSSENAD